MSVKRVYNVKLQNARMLKSNGSWVYCSSCNKTVAYLCYVTYSYYLFEFTCLCGNTGMVEVTTEDQLDTMPALDQLVIRKGRLCCPNDDSPLFSIIHKNIEDCNYKVICRTCQTAYAST